MIKNILLAEDDRGTALVIKTQLGAKGYMVYTAGNGREALKILSSFPVDLIVTDVNMPEMDGVDLYEAIKKDPRTRDIPIIIVTDKAVFKESFAFLGVSNFLEKSNDINLLLEKINSIEKNIPGVKSYSKVLITGSNEIVLEKMGLALKGLPYLVASSKVSSDIMSKALTMVPKAVFIDVLFQDNVSSFELVKALRSFFVLAQTKIITYAFFVPEELGIDVGAMHSMQQAIDLCTKAGCDKYIGRFNQTLFLEKINEIGI